MKLKLSRPAAMALLPLALASCGYLFPSTHHYHDRYKASEAAACRYPASLFVRSLTLARLSADAHTTDKADLRKLETYTAKAPLAPVPQTVLVLTYKDRPSGRPRIVVAPITLRGDMPEWGDTLQIMHRAALLPYTLSDTRLSVITVGPQEALKFHGDTPLRQTLEAQQQALLDSAEPLDPLEDAQLQLQLIDFLIDHRFRDAAYLSVDNVKRLLASAGGEDAEAVENLSQQLEALEARLHKTLPFSLSAPGGNP